jgi:hypothetical protein
MDTQKCMKLVPLCSRLSLLATVVIFSSPALADLVTIDPDNYAPGTNISNAIPGAQLLDMTVALSSNPNAPTSNNYVPVYAPTVYTAAVASGCMQLDSPCTPPGISSLISPNPVTASNPLTDVVGAPGAWGSTWWADQCIEGACSGMAAQYIQLEPVLRINFSTPTNYVSADTMYSLGNGGRLYAYDSAGDLVASCFSDGSPACATNLFTGVAAGWQQLAVSTSTADISFVLVGGDVVDLRPIAEVQFNSTAPLPPSGVLLASGVVFLLLARRAPRALRLASQ